MKTISYDELKDLQAKGQAKLVNVLPAESFAKTNIPGSVNIPHENPDFTEQVEKAIGGKNMPVIVYCASYSCDASKKSAEKLEQAGFSNVMCYEGGAKEWQEKNGSATSSTPSAA